MIQSGREPRLVEEHGQDVGVLHELGPHPLQHDELVESRGALGDRRGRRRPYLPWPISAIGAIFPPTIGIAGSAHSTCAGSIPRGRPARPGECPRPVTSKRPSCDVLANTMACQRRFHHVPVGRTARPCLTETILLPSGHCNEPQAQPRRFITCRRPRPRHGRARHGRTRVLVHHRAAGCAMQFRRGLRAVQRRHLQSHGQHLRPLFQRLCRQRLGRRRGRQHANQVRGGRQAARRDHR